MELSKALATLGFGAWNDLEPGKTKLKLGLQVNGFSFGFEATRKRYFGVRT